LHTDVSQQLEPGVLFRSQFPVTVVVLPSPQVIISTSGASVLQLIKSMHASEKLPSTTVDPTACPSTAANPVAAADAGANAKTSPAPKTAAIIANARPSPVRQCPDRWDLTTRFLKTDPQTQ
jgi:hypothetical protein